MQRNFPLVSSLRNPSWCFTASHMAASQTILESSYYLHAHITWRASSVLDPSTINYAPVYATLSLLHLPHPHIACRPRSGVTAKVLGESHKFCADLLSIIEPSVSNPFCARVISLSHQYYRLLV